MIDFISNAASWVIGCLAVIGFVAVLGGIGFILYKDLRGKNHEQDTDNQHGQGA